MYTAVIVCVCVCARSELEQNNAVSRVEGEGGDEQKTKKKRENHLRLEDLEAPTCSPPDSDTGGHSVDGYVCVCHSVCVLFFIVAPVEVTSLALPA